jgi:expansin (peptidoglycan-binding protein)
MAWTSLFQLSRRRLVPVAILIVFAMAAACGRSDAESNDEEESGDGASGGSRSASGGRSSDTDVTTEGGEIVGSTRSGEATYYAATGEGACSFDASPDDLMVAALNAPDWQGSAWCGACVRVSGPQGEVDVRIVDLCPECASGDLDLSPQAFDKVAERHLGRVPISWTFVSCHSRGNVRYRFKDGANPYWTAVQVHNHALPIRSMEWSKNGNSWTTMPRQDYNYFLEDSGFGEGSSKVRITSIDGQQLVDELPQVEESLVVEGAAQFSD